MQLGIKGCGKLSMERKRFSVSPKTVSLVIVMVVLSSLFYVIVSGWSTMKTPAGSVTSVNIVNSTTTSIRFGSFEPITAPTDIKIVFSADGENDVEIWCPNQPSSFLTDMEISSNAQPTVTAVLLDSNYVENAINEGDYVYVSNLKPGTLWTISIYHVPSKTKCSLNGAIIFKTPNS